ncbi:MAG: hybrid sensor histidine kinase/response regulator [Cellvibrionaceae bacterium]|nr:hybrid sensor histidine kinase/response regulator [Cellvibrionaceae bacterium]|tara:strand:+ start:16950 stop:20546 length:3597 start_codon:yes stop_codon:yes gene_type:complete
MLPTNEQHKTTSDYSESRPAQQIFRVRRHYNKWVGDQTLEDYALRFTATGARRWSIEKVAQTALGATAFLALEAIAASITLSYGFNNALIAMLVVAAVIFITGLPISYYAAKHGLDIDLLTRGAGFGYLGSTITSLIYASFTFIFFAIEAAILASALHVLLGIPPAVGYVLCALAVIPIVTHGITAISKFQVGSQPVWVVLQLLALGAVAWFEIDRVSDWTQYAPAEVAGSAGFDWLLFGAAASVLFAMVAQIGEQVDYLRFMPPKTDANKKRWWFWLILAGPGWVLIGLIKMLLGSFLAYLAITSGSTFEQAADPVYMYQTAFSYFTGFVTQSPTMALVLAGVMVVLSQMKINVTNAYAGSIAWSNFFSRLTHSHPGRVVWLVFNVTIALILMELGIYRALEGVLGVFAIVAVSWLASLAADLMINKPLGLSPSYVEFKRAHLYDINPVGVGSMLLASITGIVCYLGIFGELAKNLAHFISLACCFVLVPLIAWATKGRYYLARQSEELKPQLVKAAQFQDEGQPRAPITLCCCICENEFEQPDMAHCPAYQGPICSLCCSLDSRCLDSCKPKLQLPQRLTETIKQHLPATLSQLLGSRSIKFAYLMMGISLLNAGLLALIYTQMAPSVGESELLQQTLWTLYFMLLIVSGVIAWLFLLTHESRVVAQQESNRQTRLLLEEISAHRETDQALQAAKEQAENANDAKSRYLSGISHELRTPLQSILGYAQLLSQRSNIAPQHHKALQIIERSGHYLTDLIEGLLDISKIEAGRLNIQRNQVKLPELIGQLVEMFKPQAAAKGIEFYCHLHNQLPKVVIADEKRLRQILINLLSNAIKYTEKGRVDFHIYYRNQVANFSVMDTGIGIHSNDLQRILKPFERVDSREVAAQPGTGLGLTIARLLTEIMGGDLSAKSTLGNGSCFSASLMLSWVENPCDEDSLPRQICGYEGSELTVMVVDDQPLHRSLIIDLLKPLGFNMLEAEDAFACLEQLDQQQNKTPQSAKTPDLFLLDVSMPRMSGLELAKALRQRGLQQPIIMLSADAQERHRKPIDHAAHDAYLVKPVKHTDLLEQIGQQLQLQWTYASQPLTRAEDIIASASDTHHALPNAPDFSALRDQPLAREMLASAEIGFKKGVQSSLDALANESLIDPAALNQLQQWVDAMRFDKLVELLNTPAPEASQESALETEDKHTSPADHRQ